MAEPHTLHMLKRDTLPEWLCKGTGADIVFILDSEDQATDESTIIKYIEHKALVVVKRTTRINFQKSFLLTSKFMKCQHLMKSVLDNNGTKQKQEQPNHYA